DQPGRTKMTLIDLARAAAPAALLALACGAAPSSDAGDVQQTQAARPAPPTPPVAANDGVPTLAPLVERVQPTVVGVTTRTAATARGGDVPPELEEFYRRFFGEDAPPFHGGPQGPQ